MKILKSKKGVNIMDLQTLGIALVVIAVTVGLGAEVLGDIRDDQTANTYERNITTGGLAGLREIGDRLDTVGLVAVVAVILGIIMVYLGRGTQ